MHLTIFHQNLKKKTHELNILPFVEDNENWSAYLKLKENTKIRANFDIK